MVLVKIHKNIHSLQDHSSGRSSPVYCFTQWLNSCPGNSKQTGHQRLRLSPAFATGCEWYMDPSAYGAYLYWAWKWFCTKLWPLRGWMAGWVFPLLLFSSCPCWGWGENRGRGWIVAAEKPQWKPRWRHLAECTHYNRLYFKILAIPTTISLTFHISHFQYQNSF